jgi:hypothetical protein
MLSPEVSTGLWEIWLYARPAFRMSVQECGSFPSEQEACRVGAALRMWLQTSVWVEDVLGPAAAAVEVPEFPDECREWLLSAPQWLRDRGIDPARVLVTVRPDNEGDTHDMPPDSLWVAVTGSDTDDATEWVPPSRRGRTDAVNGGKGPHFPKVNVRATRR